MLGINNLLMNCVKNSDSFVSANLCVPVLEKRAEVFLTLSIFKSRLMSVFQAVEGQLTERSVSLSVRKGGRVPYKFNMSPTCASINTQVARPSFLCFLFCFIYVGAGI